MSQILLRSLGIFTATMFVVGLGCSKPEITVRTIEVPQAVVKQEREQRAALLAREAFRLKQANSPVAAAIVQRMLAALVPQPNGSRIWSFKLTGEPQAVGAAKDDFKKLLASLTWPTPDARLPEWTLPTGWTMKPAADGFGKVATLELMSGETALSIAVSTVNKPDDVAAGLLQNINRWRGQMKQAPLAADELKTGTESVALKDGAATLLDVEGSLAGPPGMTAPFAGKSTNAPPAKDPLIERTPNPHDTTDVPKSTAPEKFAPDKSTTPNTGEPHRPSAAASELIDYSAPSTWTVKPSSIRLASFSMDDGKAELGVTQFPKHAAMADPLSNVNRWRGELSLEPIKKEQLDQSTKPLKLAGEDALIFEDKSANGGKATIAVMQTRGERVWFVKLTGTPATVAAERKRLEEFLDTIRFPKP